MVASLFGWLRPLPIFLAPLVNCAPSAIAQSTPLVADLQAKLDDQELRQDEGMTVVSALKRLSIAGEPTDKIARESP